jgi:hypothetical protein
MHTRFWAKENRCETTWRDGRNTDFLVDCFFFDVAFSYLSHGYKNVFVPVFGVSEEQQQQKQRFLNI